MQIVQLENKPHRPVSTKLMVNIHHHMLLQKALHLSITLFLISSLLLPLYLNSAFTHLCVSLDLYYCKFLLPVFDHTAERKYMFLLCNVILAFIAKTSGLGRPSARLEPGVSEIEVSAASYGKEAAASTRRRSTIDEPVRYPQIDQTLDDDDEDDDENIGEQEQEEEEEPEKEYMSITEVGGRNQSEAPLVMWHEEKEKEETEEGAAGESNSVIEERLEEDDIEELNKKFEEFIRRMKEELRIQAQSQLVMA